MYKSLSLYINIYIYCRMGFLRVFVAWVSLFRLFKKIWAKVFSFYLIFEKLFICVARNIIFNIFMLFNLLLCFVYSFYLI